MKKVLFLIGALDAGGAEKVLIDTANSLDSMKYEITVQALFDTPDQKKKLKDHIRYKAIIRRQSGLLRKIAAKLLFYILDTKFVYNLYVRDDYDYEIAFLEGLPTKVISKSTNKHAMKIAWIHIDLQKLPGSVYAFGSEKKEKAAYQRFDKIFCVSKAVKTAFLNKYDVTTPTGILYNVLEDKAIIEASREDVVLPTNIRPCLISVGRLCEQKGYDRLLRIHKKLLEEGCVHSLLIVGEGPLRQQLEVYIKEHNLEHTAFLLGFQTNPYKYMRKADLFVCSSYVEGFSTVISESVLCGTPVLATDVAGNREPEEMPRCSIIVENDETALYQSLRAVLQLPESLVRYREELQTRQNFFKKESLIAAFEKKVFEE